MFWVISVYFNIRNTLPKSGTFLLRHPVYYIYITYIYIFFFSVALRPNAGHGLLILEVSRSHTTTHHSRQDSSGRVISSPQRPLPDSTQHSQQTNIHAPGGIRTHDLSRRAAADLRLRPRGHWDRHMYVCMYVCMYVYIYIYTCMYIYIYIKAWTDPEGSRSLRLPDFKTVGT